MNWITIATVETRREAAWRFGGFGLLAWFLSVPLVWRGQSVQPEPVQAVLAWYKAFDGASGSQAQYQGTVGSGPYPWRDAYGLLAPELRNRMSRSAFEESYARVAHMKLLQAHLARIDESAREADVFVEEERTVVFERTLASSGIPAVVWYEGTLHLTETSGAWQIAAFSLKPEDIISMEYGGHSPWRGDPVEVAKVATSLPNAYPNQPCLSAEPKVDSGVAEVEICGDRRYRVRLVKLHSGEWRAISTDPPPPAAVAITP